MKITALRWSVFLGYITGGSLAGLFAFRSHDPASWGIALIAIAGALKALLPAESVAANAPVVNNAGEKVGTNLSSSTDLFVRK